MTFQRTDLVSTFYTKLKLLGGKLMLIGRPSSVNVSFALVILMEAERKERLKVKKFFIVLMNNTKKLDHSSFLWMPFPI